MTHDKLESVCKVAGMLEWKNGAYAAALVLLAPFLGVC